MKTTILLGAALAIVAAHARAAGDAARGQQLYALRCAACHSIDYNGVGPAHKDLIGRRAGTAPGYSYSPALKNSTVVWDEASLTRWLSGPEQFIPGQKMFFSIPDPQERADIVAWLLQAGRRRSVPTTSGEPK
ncbi:c-type cytochrome [Caenimonas terrae]|uniref:C-type cytochrome n=1 Tax=Caenimonas terrae TaxID=696074 RepID=A0ABW0N9S8_9BURK